MGVIKHCRICGKEDPRFGLPKLGLCNACYQRGKRHGGDYTAGRKSNDGRSKHPLYCDFVRMQDRVRGNPTGCKENYSDRGITICERWSGPDGFANFVKDMGPKPSYKKTPGGRAYWTLDRINNDKGYSPENCRWASPEMQANNTRRNKIYTINGFTGTFHQCFNRFSVVKQSTAEMRFYVYNWSLEDSLITPKGRRPNVPA